LAAVEVVVLSSARWDSPPLSKHYIARALAELGHDVLYVEPPVSILSPLRDRSRLRDLVGPTLRVIKPRLRVWRPRAVPAQNSSASQWVNARLIERGLARLMPSPDLVVAFPVEARGVLGRLGGRHVYYCTDGLGEAPGFEASVVAAQEAELIKAADVVVACSRPLVEDLERRGIAAAYLPHGVEDPCPTGPGSHVPAEFDGHPRPWIGFVGSLNHRLDAELLDAARRGAGPGTLFVVGGWGAWSGPQMDGGAATVMRAPNVLMLSERDAGDLGPLLCQLDVGVVPYKRDGFNRMSFPLKIPLYLAAGAPVVSSPNGATDELHGLLDVAEDAVSFEEAVVRAASHDTPERRKARRAAALDRPWTRVAEELISLVMRTPGDGRGGLPTQPR
jgi:teichuronic acid biosynthesis glycosyltransferase TuaH